ncbi:MAG TPA: DEAD/DEAH box helicase [Chthoniobacteraceae bacterium]|jgi:hypothetical protein|nr:DEAD/DEAH box helicase [Chthoniobacteraceae bacterium]
MSIPLDEARRVAAALRADRIVNLYAQSRARQVLQEVKESPANYPVFDPVLEDKITFTAFGLLAAGCSMLEAGATAEGIRELESAGTLLESAHAASASEVKASSYHCLVAAMAFYAVGHYSRAFVLIQKIEAGTPVAGLIAAFIRRDTATTVSRINETLLIDVLPVEDQALLDEQAVTTAVARTLSLILEFTVTGLVAHLGSSAQALSDALIIATTGQSPALWWLVRLLRLMLGDFGSASLWKVIPPFFAPESKAPLGRYIRLLACAKPPITELWVSQRAALALALNLKNRGGVVNLRTSAGKTRVGELAILQTLAADPAAKVLYLAPFRSLAFEIERTFCKTLAPLGFTVSHLYGGARFSAMDRELAIESALTIATPEKAKAMFRAAPELFEKVTLIIVDEGHLVDASDRLVRNELFVDHLRAFARVNGARILLLSAVLPNAGELAEWVAGSNANVATSNWKPSAERFGLLRWSTGGVRIQWYGEVECFNPRFVEFKTIEENGKSRKFPKNKTEAVAATAARLSKLGPVLIFAGQAQWVESMTKAVLNAFDELKPYKWPEAEWKIFEAVCAEEFAENSLELRAARLGIICHSNLLPPQVRMAVEALMAKKAPKVIVATTTLGQGVNIGISSVIVSTPYYSSKVINKRDFWNICGRAGRAFIDGEGKVLYAIDGTKRAWQIKKDEKMAKEYFDLAKVEHVKSGLLELVCEMSKAAKLAGVDFDRLIELVANNDFTECGEHSAKFAASLDLIDDELLALHADFSSPGDGDSVDWVDDAFRESLAAIQARAGHFEFNGDDLIRFLKARTRSTLTRVPDPQQRKAIVASGLPYSVAIAALGQLPYFRKLIDWFLQTDQGAVAMGGVVTQLEKWARTSAVSVVRVMPDTACLDKVRPLWLNGTALREILKAEEGAADVCKDLYGYQIPWLLHAIAQKLDKDAEEVRVKAFAKIGLLVELGLPSEAAAKVFLAGVRSRVAATELAPFIDPAASLGVVRAGLIDPGTMLRLESIVSPSSFEWLQMLKKEHADGAIRIPQFRNFTLPAPESLSELHTRALGDRIFLCSPDGFFKSEVLSTLDLPFGDIANDLKFAFRKYDGSFHLSCRDPRFEDLLSL